ncbi:MAG: rhomboid family intramembrane serine protease [Candidatus Woesearchaeota archaeon]
MTLKVVEDFLREVNFYDFLVYLSLPILISIIQVSDYLFGISNYFVLNINDPSLWQFFTSSYTHLSLTHFFSNLSSYLIIGLILLVISNKINKKKVVFILFLVISLILPFIISLFHFFFNPFNVEIMAGSSGLICAYLGLIPLFWGYLFLKSKRNLFKLIISLYFYVLFVFILRYYNILVSLFFLSISLMIMIYFDFKEFNFKKINDLNYFKKTLFLFPIFFFIISIHFYVFPNNLVIDNAIIEYFSHFIGITFGQSLSFIYLLFKRSFS